MKVGEWFLIDEMESDLVLSEGPCILRIKEGVDSSWACEEENVLIEADFAVKISCYSLNLKQAFEIGEYVRREILHIECYFRRTRIERGIDEEEGPVFILGFGT